MDPFPTTAGGRCQCLGHDFIGTAPVVKADIRGLFAVPALSVFHSRYLLSTAPAFTILFPPPVGKAGLSVFPPVAEKGRFPPVTVVDIQAKNTAPGVT